MLEAAPMRIRVTIAAFAEGNSCISRFPVMAWRMAILACDLRVQSGQRVARFRMVQLADAEGLPVGVVMALQTIRAQPSFVLILVATGAALRETEERPVEILDLDGRTLAGRYALRVVTAAARRPHMLAFKGIPRLLVVECLDIKSHKNKVFSIVVGVAGDTFLAGTGLDAERCVQALAGRDARANFAVADGATKRWFSGREFVAGGAIGCSIQGLVRAGERARGNLGGARYRGRKNKQHRPPKNSARNRS